MTNKLTSLIDAVNKHPSAVSFEITGGIDRLGNEYYTIEIFRDSGSSPMHIGDNSPWLVAVESINIHIAIQIAIKRLQAIPENFQGYTSFYSAQKGESHDYK